MDSFSRTLKCLTQMYAPLAFTRYKSFDLPLKEAWGKGELKKKKENAVAVSSLNAANYHTAYKELIKLDCFPEESAFLFLWSLFICTVKKLDYR